jgi:hypothetical protein
MAVHCFGIRHHGPGSARSLLQALQALQPDCLLIEGPPDAEALIPLAAQGLQPPVAILIYSPENPSQAVYYPFAVFSPEWQALQYGLQQQIPIRWMDLPQAHQFHKDSPSETLEEAAPPETAPPEATPVDLDPIVSPPVYITHDPISLLAEAAGYNDGERWWEQLVEHRREAGDVFAAIAEMMTALRDELPTEQDPRALRREAWMRQTIRQAEKDGFERIAVVCGAWHVPALQTRGPASADKALLKGLPKTKVAATWIPWTHSRLSWASGYGAGIASPGWYHHLWSAGEPLVTRWMAKVAQLLRAKGQDVSSAHLIEAVRLAETLAALRAKALPGLEELNEATRAVLTHGQDTPLQLIHQELVLGQALGEVPDTAPMLPIQQDLLQQQKSLRLKPEASDKDIDLDLRKPHDLAKSHLLHRLLLLNVPWGQKRPEHRGQSTFHERWQLRWDPELMVALIEAGLWGNTIHAAALARTVDQAHKAKDLAALTALLDATLLADLPAALEALMGQLQARATATADLLQLLEALPPLARVLRYGDVRTAGRETTAPLRLVVDGLLVRICAGLAAAVSGLSDDAAQAYQAALRPCHQALQTVAEEAWLTLWDEALAQVQTRPGVPGLLVGYATRLRFDSGRLSLDGLTRDLGWALSQAADPALASQWLEGFLQGSGLILVHHEALLGLLNRWVMGLSEAHFIQLLPLLRRTISQFSRAERQQIGALVRQGAARLEQPTVPATGPLSDPRIPPLLPILHQLLGVPQ